MRFPSTLLALYSSILSPPSLPTTYTPTRNVTLTFDDLPPALRLSSLPAVYHNLNFSLFSAFAPHSPFLKNYITPPDLNCAVSPPNALLGSRSEENGQGASFEIANVKAMAEGGLQPYFTLRSLQIKPLNAPAPGTVVWIKGFRYGGEEISGSRDSREPVVRWSVKFPSGYHFPLLVDLDRFSKESWEGLYKVEIGADFGYDKLDWEFCLDDLEMQFVEIADSKRRGPVVNSKILGSDW